MAVSRTAIAMQLARVHHAAAGDQRYSGAPKAGAGPRGQLVFAAMKIAMARCANRHGLKQYAIAAAAEIPENALKRMLSSSDSTHPFTLESTIALLSPGVMPDEVRLEAIQTLGELLGVRLLAIEAFPDLTVRALLLRACQAVGKVQGMYADAIDPCDGNAQLTHDQAECLLPDVVRAEVLLGALHARLFHLLSSTEPDTDHTADH